MGQNRDKLPSRYVRNKECQGFPGKLRKELVNKIAPQREMNLGESKKIRREESGKIIPPKELISWASSCGWISVIH
jgi:hypothetical protein